MIIDFPLCVKSINEQGRFAGLASTYGNVDRVGDIVERGAFAATLQAGRELPILWAHDTALPVGLGELSDTAEGLALDGTLNLDVEPGRMAYSNLTKRIIRGLSIGFRVPEGGAALDEKGIRRLRKIDLYEISLVAVPANDRARVLSVKAEIESVRDFERFLHASGWSKREAAALAAGGFKALVPQPAPADDEKFVHELSTWLTSAAGR